MARRWRPTGPPDRGLTPGRVGQHFALLVDDLDGTVAELRERAVEVSDPKPVGSSHQAFLTDPSGNLVELHQVTG